MEEMRCKKGKLRVRGYTLIESIVAISILSLSLVLSVQVLSTPMLGQSQSAILDMEHVADSITVMATKGLITNQMVVNRPWGVVQIETQIIETPRRYVIISMNGLTHLGLRIPLKNELHEMAE